MCVLKCRARNLPRAVSLTVQRGLWFNLRSVAIKNGNGSHDGSTGSAAQQMNALKVTFRDRWLSFRHFPQAKCSDLKWQAIRPVVEPVTMPDGKVRSVERFELVGWAKTCADLIAQLD